MKPLGQTPLHLTPVAQQPHYWIHFQHWCLRVFTRKHAHTCSRQHRPCRPTTGNIPRCISSGMDKVWNIHTKEYNMAMEMTKLQPHQSHKCNAGVREAKHYTGECTQTPKPDRAISNTEGRPLGESGEWKGADEHGPAWVYGILRKGHEGVFGRKLSCSIT